MLAWEPMTTWQSGDVRTNGIRMHYYRTVGDKPVLVLAHGATDDGLCWTRVARALEDDYDVFMPDARRRSWTACVVRSAQTGAMRSRACGALSC